MLRFAWRQRHQPGFILLDIILGLSVFVIFMISVGMVLLVGRESTQRSGDRARAVYLAEQMLEAVRSMRGASFNALVNDPLVADSIATGTRHGLAQDEITLLWKLTADPTVSDGMTKKILFSSGPPGVLRATARIEWQDRLGVATFELSTELSDWATEQRIGNWWNIQTERRYPPNNVPQPPPAPPTSPSLFNDIALYGNTAYVTSAESPGAERLFIFDLANIANPAIRNILGGGGYAVAIRGQTLYVATTDASAEVKTFDISTTPTNPVPGLSIDINTFGNGNVRALAIAGNVLLVGGRDDTGNPALFRFGLTDPTTFTLLGPPLPAPGDIRSIRVLGPHAFIATNAPGTSQIVADISNPASMQWVNGLAYAASAPGLSVAASGLRQMLGTHNGGGNDTFLFTIDQQSAPATSVVTAQLDAQGDVAAMVLEPTNCFGFIGSNNPAAEVKVLLLGPNPAVKNVNIFGNASVRGMRYDVVRDRLYVLSDYYFWIYRPPINSTAPASCTP